LNASALEEIDLTVLPPPAKAILIVRTVFLFRAVRVIAYVKQGSPISLISFFAVFNSRGAGSGIANGEKMFKLCSNGYVIYPLLCRHGALRGIWCRKICCILEG
jgi:hypothetical protein